MAAASGSTLRRIRTGGKVLEHFGFTIEHVAAAALRLLGKNKDADKLDADYQQANRRHPASPAPKDIRETAVDRSRGSV